MTGEHDRPVERPPVLPTKLRPTIAPAARVPGRIASLLRPRHGTLTLVHAGAGYGKTTALAATQGREWIWYNLDVADRDPSVFAQRIGEAIGVEPLADEAAGAEGLALELATRLSGRPTTLTLDRGETLAYAADLGRFLGELLLLAPALALRIATRVRPALPLERLRLEERLIEVGPAELRLDRGEIASVLAAAWGRPPRPAELDFADGILGGWPAALRLWQGALPADGDLLAPLQAGQPLHEYLHEEVVETLPADVLDQIRRDWRWLLSRGPIAKRATNANRRLVADRLIRDRVGVVPGRNGWSMHPLMVAFGSLHTARATVPVPAGPEAAVASPAGSSAPAGSASRLTIRTFGGLGVIVDGAPLPDTAWPASARRLLELLLCRPGYRTTAHEAAQMLWPQHPQPSARNSFNVALHGLRRALEPVLTDGAQSRYVVREGRQYRLQVDRLACDADQFRQVAGDIPAPFDEASARRLQEAVDLQGGAFLAGSEEPFVENRRSQLRGMLLSGLEQLGQWYASAGRGELAVSVLERLVALEPARHTAWQRLLDLHADVDRLASAG